MLGTVEDIDHRMYIIAEADKYELADVPGKKVMDRFNTIKFYRDALNKKEQAGNLSWTLGMYATQNMADDVGLTLDEYWDEIIHACYLDLDDPIAKWREVDSQIKSI